MAFDRDPFFKIQRPARTKIEALRPFRNCLHVHSKRSEHLALPEVVQALKTGRQKKVNSPSLFKNGLSLKISQAWLEQL